MQVIVLVAVFCFCWGPYATFAMINISGHGKVDLSFNDDVGIMKLVISEHLHLYPEQGHQYYHHDRPQDVPLILTILPLQLCKTVIVWNPVIFVIMNPMVKFLSPLFFLVFLGERQRGQGSFLRWLRFQTIFLSIQENENGGNSLKISQ